MSDDWDDLPAVLEQAQKARADQDKLRAHALYIRATQLDPHNAVAWAGRAAMSFDVDDAIVSWGYALTLAPQDQEARTLLARRVQERIAQSGAGDAKNLIALGRQLAQAGQRIFAHPLFVLATELADREDEAWVWRAGSSDSTTEAISCLNHALALNPENRQARAGLQWILSQQVGARPTTLEESSEQASKQVAEGRRMLKLGDKSRAHEFFVRATELDHGNESAWLWSASTTHDVDEALVCIEQALVIHPENRATHDARQWLWARKLQKAPKRIPPSPAPIAPINLSVEAKAPPNRIRVLLLAIAIILLILLTVNLLQTSGGYIP